MTINELVERSGKQAEDMGWNKQLILFPEMAALLHSEVSEALEAYRNKEPISWVQRDLHQNMKPMGIASEFADILIRVGHYSVLLGIHDLEGEVLRKLDYNLTRGYRHGGKIA